MDEMNREARPSQGTDCAVCGEPMRSTDQGEFLDQDMFDPESWFQIIAHIECGEENGLEKVGGKR